MHKSAHALQPPCGLCLDSAPIPGSVSRAIHFGASHHDQSSGMGRDQRGGRQHSVSRRIQRRTAYACDIGRDRCCVYSSRSGGCWGWSATEEQGDVSPVSDAVCCGGQASGDCTALQERLRSVRLSHQKSVRLNKRASPQASGTAISSHHLEDLSSTLPSIRFLPECIGLES